MRMRAVRMELVVSDSDNKTCSKCGLSKDITEFYKMSSSRDGRRPDCKACSKELKLRKIEEDPVWHKIYNMATGIHKRTSYEIDRTKNRSYKKNGVKCCIGDTSLEIAHTLESLFYDEIKGMIESGIIPSVDRIDSSSNYEVGNIRIIPLDENVSLGNKKGTAMTCKPIIAIFSDGGKKTYNSVSECSRDLSINRKTIIRHRDNGTSTDDGITFEFLKN